MKAMRTKTRLVLQNKLLPKVKEGFTSVSAFSISVGQNGVFDGFDQHPRRVIYAGDDVIDMAGLMGAIVSSGDTVNVYCI